jgi:hypothetical protein
MLRVAGLARPRGEREHVIELPDRFRFGAARELCKQPRPRERSVLELGHGSLERVRICGSAQQEGVGLIDETGRGNRRYVQMRSQPRIDDRSSGLGIRPREG